MNAKKPVLLSAIKPTGNLHIGNYFGAMRQQVAFFQSGNYECYIMVADYHALNFIQDAKEMHSLSLDLATAYMAVGLNPVSDDVFIFKQSEVPAHTELTWIFDSITTMPYLMRAHAFKDSEAKNSEISVGTFNYPMLMAADILLYDTEIVPVGQDQKQHIEYARDTAEKFNRIFGGPMERYIPSKLGVPNGVTILTGQEQIFKLPKEHIMDDVAVVPGIDGQKMSKSYGNTIPLFGSREVITERVMSIVTDSSGDRPENVYAIHRLLKNESELAPLYDEHQGKYKILKEALIEDLDAFIAPMRERYEALKENPEIVQAALKKGGEKARAVSETKMDQIRKAIGVA